ncbi:MAG TPA: hypothetical protein VFQ76_04130 [Longimicrobiaceae bacterium]|nr:hypothetical protein [Longimicrobiaceae bacterium]
MYSLAVYKEAARTGNADELPPPIVLGALEWFAMDSPEETRDRTKRALLEMFARKLDEEEIDPPEWVRLGWIRWGRWGEGEGEL